jgi:pimeloyl-ACP methyl ester carboxylesterase
MVISLRTGVAALAALVVAACASTSQPDMSSMDFVDAAGVRTHVAQGGEGDPVLLIHGASSDMGVWAPTVVPMLKDRFRLVAYDRPGMGFTAERPPDADTLEVQAEVAAGVIERMGVEKPVVVAHSWGGAVALRLALDRPDLVSGLVLVAPVAYEWPGGVSWHLYWSSNPLVGGLFNNVLTRPFAKGAVRDGLEGAFAPSPVPENYLKEAGSLRAARPAAMHANGLDMVAAKREVIGQQARYPAIKVPVALLAGDGDDVVSTAIHSIRLAQTLPNARLDVVRGAGHLPHEAAPDRFLELFNWVDASK